MTGAPDKYVGYAGTDTPVCQWASSLCPTYKYVASSRNAVLDQASRSDSTAWTVRMHNRPSGARETWAADRLECRPATDPDCAAAGSARASRTSGRGASVPTGECGLIARSAAKGDSGAAAQGGSRAAAQGGSVATTGAQCAVGGSGLTRCQRSSS